MIPLILASASPRRQEILQYFSLPFETIPHTANERDVVWDHHPFEYAQKLAAIKAESLIPNYPDRLILAADTIVFLEGILLNKPNTRDEAHAMLQLLSGKTHTVITALTLSCNNHTLTKTQTTSVLFHELTEDHMTAYLDTNSWTDKAGGYAIQKIGAMLVNKIEGCYYNVMGLPVGLLSSMLHHYGIDLWHYIH